ncbi:SPFH domain-containing protein [Tahibacter amnicola]|uniref:SPFH domain-containing protein n=1 Tax=Tahibacter amnicola TaxID=2976241 RepID=A0ABY6BJC9_9GAMM|nr:SPFH domain-containing protein [Tahibacter amnicola]UXI68485.1 SPFH domain-containing protein [Tahibacter amnicola]
MSPNTIFALFCVLALLAFLSVKRIPEGTVYTLRRFDGHARTLKPGTHVVVPLVERVVHRIPLTGCELAVNEQIVLDGTPRQLKGQLYWQVLDPERADTMIDRADELIRIRALNAMRDVDAPAHESFDLRNARLKRALNDNLRDRGVVVTRVQLHLV